MPLTMYITPIAKYSVGFVPEHLMQAEGAFHIFESADSLRTNLRLQGIDEATTLERLGKSPDRDASRFSCRVDIIQDGQDKLRFNF